MPTLKSPGKTVGGRCPSNWTQAAKGMWPCRHLAFLLRSRRPPSRRWEGAGGGGCFPRGPAPFSCPTPAGSLLPASLRYLPQHSPEGMNSRPGNCVWWGHAWVQVGFWLKCPVGPTTEVGPIASLSWGEDGPQPGPAPWLLGSGSGSPLCSLPRALPAPEAGDLGANWKHGRSLGKFWTLCASWSDGRARLCAPSACVLSTAISREFCVHMYILYF